MNERFDVVVVGAGPAGSAAATVLAGFSRRVLVLEKDVFPRHKVCGEFLSADALPSLERLGARVAVEEASSERMTRGAFHLPGGEVVRFDLPAPSIGISRFRLDELLASRAREAGACVTFSARVLAAEPSGSERFRVRFVHEGSESEVDTGAVVGAWGRWDSLDRALDRGFLGRRARFFGWSRDFRLPRGRLEGEVNLYLFPGGYCGLSRVEGGAVNLAGVVSDRAWKRAGGGWEAVVRAARRGNAALDRDLAAMTAGPIGYLGTGPVFFTSKPATENGILMAGDAAGVIDPFSGEGQAAALAGGILAGETLERRLAGELSREECAHAYEVAWRRRFAKRFAWSALFRRLMLHRTVGAVARRLAGERLVRFAIGRLATDGVYAERRNPRIPP